MRNADDDPVDRSSEKITPGSGISRCQEVKNPPLGVIIIILSSSHLIILIIILISNPCILSAQRVSEPDPLPGISVDTRPDPIQFWKSSGSG